MPSKQTPDFALVLGSGGVKSVAALGVVEVLRQQGRQPDLIVGCSAGALFGALLAMGLTCAAAAKLATGLWSREITSKRRHRALLELALPRMAGFDSHFALRDDRLIGERLTQAFGNLRIEDLPVRLRISATDALTGAAVVLERGSLVDALRASIALPFLFAPKEVDGRRLSGADAATG